MKQLITILLLINITLSTCAMSLKREIIAPGIYRWTMLTAQNEVIGTISGTEGKVLAMFTSPVMTSLNKAELPPDVVRLMNQIQAISTKQNLEKVIVIGDLHVPVAHRGKNFAQILLYNVCQQLSNIEIETIILIPDPFEYIDGKETIISDPLEYEEKKRRLIKLYSKCGFVEDQAMELTYMYRKNGTAQEKPH